MLPKGFVHSVLCNVICMLKATNKHIFACFTFIFGYLFVSTFIASYSVSHSCFSTYSFLKALTIWQKIFLSTKYFVKIFPVWVEADCIYRREAEDGRRSVAIQSKYSYVWSVRVFFLLHFFDFCLFAIFLCSSRDWFLSTKVIQWKYSYLAYRTFYQLHVVYICNFVIFLFSSRDRFILMAIQGKYKFTVFNY